MPRRRSGSGSSPSGLRSSATTPPIWKLPCEKASRPTSASSRVGSGRRTTTGRSSSSRASPGESSRSTPRSRPRSSRSRAGSQSGCGAPTPILLRASASRRLCPRSRLARRCGHRPRRRSRHGQLRRRRPARAPWGAPAPLAARGRLGAVREGARRHHDAGTTHPTALRRQRVRGREGACRRGRRRRRRRGDDLRPRLRDPHRPRCRAGSRGTRRRAREGVHGAARRVSVRARRANRAGARARALSRAWAHARHGGVVHGRARRRTAHLRPGLERRLPRRHRRVRQRGQGAAFSASRRTFSPSTGPFPPRWPPRWRTPPASGSASTSRSR